MKVKTGFKNMNIFERAAGVLTPRFGRQILVFVLPLNLFFAAWPQNLTAQQDEQDPAQAPQRQQYIQQTPEQLQQLVATYRPLGLQHLNSCAAWTREDRRMGKNGAARILQRALESFT